MRLCVFVSVWACVCVFVNMRVRAGLQRWVDKINLEAEKNCAIIIVGNKADLCEADESQRKVTLAEAKVMLTSGLFIIYLFSFIVILFICFYFHLPAVRGDDKRGRFGGVGQVGTGRQRNV